MAPKTNADEGWITTREEYGETWNPEAAGDAATGVYEGVRMVEVDDLNKPGEKRMTAAYQIRTQDGQGGLNTVWGSYNIDEGMKDVPIGNLVRITYVDEVELKGGRSVKQFRVQHKAP